MGLIYFSSQSRARRILGRTERLGTNQQRSAEDWKLMLWSRESLSSVVLLQKLRKNSLSLVWYLQRSRCLKRDCFFIVQCWYFPMPLDQSERKCTINLNTLPDDVLFAILRYCDTRSLSVLSRVCRNLYRVARDDSIWKRIALGYINVHPSDRK